MSRLIFFAALLWGTTLYTMWRGGRTERATAIVLAINFVATPQLVQPWPLVFASFESRVALLDLATFLVLLAIALRSVKFWPLWMSAMQGVVTLAHLGPLAGVAINSWTYQAAMASWSYPQLVLLAWVTWLGTRRGPRMPAVTG